jgi:hypothetical protein
VWNFPGEWRHDCRGKYTTSESFVLLMNECEITLLVELTESGSVPWRTWTSECTLAVVSELLTTHSSGTSIEVRTKSLILSYRKCLWFGWRHVEMYWGSRCVNIHINL